MGRFVRNKEILEAIDVVSHHGRVASSLDAVAKYLGTDADPAFERQTRNLASKSGYNQGKSGEAHRPRSA